ncbi:uncharacterized protein LOC6597846 [Drosophila persimilis]|uniref:uncharacterized protein LOC6597846 n=1 Tax=Drosophila persimilis TaxID=7234 RepID=UPI000F0730FE|nr:uncharacterized protein LOC6597846 [Drosophila persimilis]
MDLWPVNVNNHLENGPGPGPGPGPGLGRDPGQDPGQGPQPYALRVWLALAMGLMGLFSLHYARILRSVSIRGSMIVVSVICVVLCSVIRCTLGPAEVKQWLDAMLEEPWLTIHDVEATQRATRRAIKQFIATGTYVMWKTSRLLLTCLRRLHVLGSAIDLPLLTKILYAGAFVAEALANRAHAAWRGIRNQISNRLRLNRFSDFVQSGAADPSCEASHNEHKQSPTVLPEDLNGESTVPHFLDDPTSSLETYDEFVQHLKKGSLESHVICI